MKKILCSLILIANATSPPDTGAHSEAVVIFNLTQNKLLIANNADKPFNPASLQKLFTAYAALKLLEPKYKFTTSMGATGRISGNTLYGDLVIKFSGDPTLTTKDMQYMLSKIKNTHIKGNIIIQGADYDYTNYGPGWMWDELDDCYAAPVSNFIINKNCIRANIDNIDNHTKLTLLEPLDIPLRYNIYFSKDPLEHCDMTFKPGRDNYLLSGCIPYDKNHDHIDIAIRNPERHIAKVIKKILAEQKITLTKNILIKNTSKDYNYSYIYKHYSDSLIEMIRTMLKQSDNMIADSLYKKIGHIYSQETGSWGNGKTAILSILAKNNIIMDNKQLKDGSGLSRYNTMTAMQALELLKTIKNDKEAFSIILDSLPIAGIDGTLAWMKDKNLSGKVHAKTGSMSNVYNLAGYFSTKDNDYAFVIMTSSAFADTKTQKQLAKEAMLKQLSHLQVSLETFASE